MFEYFAKFFSAWSDAGDLKMIAEITMAQGALGAAEDQIKDAASSYSRDKSERNTAKVRATVQRVEGYLTKVAWSGTKLFDIPVDLTSSAGYMVKTMHAQWARRQLTNIDLLQLMESLPPDPTPWSTRRASYVRQQKNLTAMATQFENVVLRKAEEVKLIGTFKARIMGIALGDDMTDDQLLMLQQDMNAQDVDERSAKRYMAIFGVLAQASRKTAENMATLIKTGDLREKSKR